jgi:DNA polymerase-3 subunit delta'
MLTGPEGLGKATLASQLALRMLAEAADPSLGAGELTVPPEHRIASLVAARTHPDYKRLERLPKDDKLHDKDWREWPPGYERARSIKVDQVRALTASFATTPSLSQRRVVIIDAIDDLEREAANALLKSLEEPPAGTIFLLVNHVPGRVLPTIRSRCRTLRFSGLSDDVMTTILRQRQPELDPGELKSLIAAAEGAPGRALALAGLDLGAIERELEALAEQGDPDNARRIGLATKLSAKSAQARYELFLDRVPRFVSDVARSREGDALGTALDQWEQCRKLAQSAVHASLEPYGVVFTLASYVAALAPARGAAKA